MEISLHRVKSVKFASRKYPIEGGEMTHDFIHTKMEIDTEKGVVTINLFHKEDGQATPVQSPEWFI